jgi:lytic murein transglycosylase
MKQHKYQNLLIGAHFYIPMLCMFLFIFLSQPVHAASASLDEFRAWIASFRATAIQGGIRPGVYDSVTGNLTPDFSLADLDIPSRTAKQPEQAEFVRTPEQYVSDKYLTNLAEQGRRLFAAHKDTLAAIKKTYGIDPYLLLALWGRETAFGTYNLPHNALQVLATQAYIGRRKELFQKQFLLAIQMVQDGVIQPKDMKSSWAGAMGMVQFLPEDYYKYAVDQDGDGKRDIWKSIPDALGSLANNLIHIGWNNTQPWGIEVRAAKTVDCSLAYLDLRKPVKEWAAMGIAPVKGETFPPEMQDWEASLLLPAGTFGPAFLTFQNFQVIREYNKADLYALFVGHLADRIRGSGSFSRPWEKIVQVSTADVEDMQRRLTGLGLYSDTIDGKAGGRTRSAVGAYQKRAGLAQTCWPTAEIVAHLRTHAKERSSSAAQR